MVLGNPSSSIVEKHSTIFRLLKKNLHSLPPEKSVKNGSHEKMCAIYRSHYYYVCHVWEYPVSATLVKPVWAVCSTATTAHFELLKMCSKLLDVLVEDVRFPTSLELDGSDASHPDPDYSAVYVTLVTDVDSIKGFGISFSLGRGNEIIKHCVDSMRFLVVDRNIKVHMCISSRTLSK